MVDAWPEAIGTKDYIFPQRQQQGIQTDYKLDSNQSQGLIWWYRDKDYK